jgi:hypothetical protein
MDYAGHECVPREASLIESFLENERTPARHLSGSDT